MQVTLFVSRRANFDIVLYPFGRGCCEEWSYGMWMIVRRPPRHHCTRVEFRCLIEVDVLSLTSTSSYWQQS